MPDLPNQKQSHAATSTSTLGFRSLKKVPNDTRSSLRGTRNPSPLSKMQLAQPCETACTSTSSNETACTSTSSSVSINSGGGRRKSEPCLSTDPRSDFEIVYDMSRTSESSAIQHLATVLCRDDIAGMECRMKRNKEEFNETIVATKAQVEKIKEKEKAWPSNLPSDLNSDYAKILAGNDQKIDESIKYLEDLKTEYEGVRQKFQKMRELKADRKMLVRQQKFMQEHEI